MITAVSQYPLPDSFPRQQFAGRVQFRSPESDDQFDELVKQANVLYSHRVPESVPAETPHLRWIQTPSAGVNHLRHLPVWKSDIVITSARGVHTVPMSEHAFAMLLALARGLPAVFASQQRHVWNHGIPTFELREKTLGIVGWGKIGDGVAHLARAFGMRVIGTRRSATEAHDVEHTVEAYFDPPWLEAVDLPPDRIYPGSDLDIVLRQSDVVLLILPLTEETQGSFGAAQFGAMKEGAIFLNIGRGAVVDETALIAALQSGHLGGAGLDVFAKEPLPPDSPLWDMHIVIVSPHLGGNSERTDERAAHLFAVNLARFLEGEPLLNVVDRMQQY